MTKNIRKKRSSAEIRASWESKLRNKGNHNTDNTDNNNNNNNN